MRMFLPIACATLAMTVLLSEAVAETGLDQNLVDSRQGGWRGGDISMTCLYDGRKIMLAIFGGHPIAHLGGAQMTFYRTSLLPFGFVMTAPEGRFFSAVSANFVDKRLELVPASVVDHARSSRDFRSATCQRGLFAPEPERRDACAEVCDAVWWRNTAQKQILAKLARIIHQDEVVSGLHVGSPGETGCRWC